jgi:DNA (cytosine-5)-methyltransferase 1
MIFRLGELFSGPGGLAVGAMASEIAVDGVKWGVRHAWANDIDPDSCETYRNNICPDDRDSVVCAPVQKVDFNKWKRDPKKAIDAFAFGFPCNDYSIVGEQKGMDGSFGPLYSYGVKVLDAFSPDWFMAENVGGLANANSGEAFRKILAALERAGGGYTVTPHLYCFEDYGVPQARHRIIMVGINKRHKLTFRVPAPLGKKPKTALEAIAVPPIKPDAPNNEYTRQSAIVVKRLKTIPPGKNAWYEGVPVHLRLRVKGARLSQIYRRLDPHKPAYTITGSGGGGTHVYHWKEPRALTNRERARLQTFPDHHVFVGSKESVRKQIGMAVPPQGAKILVDAVLKTFARVSYPSISDQLTSVGRIAERAAVLARS